MSLPADSPEPGYETFDHGADIGVRGRGPDPAHAFECAALALTSVVCEPSSVAPAQAIAIACADDDLELLLHAFLAALVYEMASRRMLFSRFEVTIEAGRLEARAWGEPVDVGRHRPAVEVKGPTLTELGVGREPDGSWLAQCVVDV